MSGYEIEKSSKIKLRKFFKTVPRKIILNYEVLLLHVFGVSGSKLCSRK